MGHPSREQALVICSRARLFIPSVACGLFDAIRTSEPARDRAVTRATPGLCRPAWLPTTGQRRPSKIPPLDGLFVAHLGQAEAHGQYVFYRRPSTKGSMIHMSYSEPSRRYTIPVLKISHYPKGGRMFENCLRSQFLTPRPGVL
jgi:hypothetical protein